MVLVSLVSASLALLGTLLGVWWGLRRITHAESALLDLIPEPHEPADFRDELAEYLSSIDVKMSDMERRVRNLQLDLEEGIQRVDRAERRTRAVVTKARRELREAGYEHPGIEAEDSQLRLLDGGISDGEGVQPLSEDMAVDPTNYGASPIPGVTVGDFNHLMTGA